MKLKKLELRNFRGIRELTVEPDGKSISIYGDNGTGKSTIGDAIVWLLTEKDTLKRTTDDMGIKTRDENGDVIHGLDHSVEAVFDNIVLKKTYREKWTRSRGAAEAEFTGHTIDYYVDSIPVKKKEYDAAVREIIDDELLPILTIPSYFPEQLHWEKRRKVLTELAGDIDIKTIIETYPELSRYPEILNGKTEDNAIAGLKSRKKKLNDSIDDIPIRIDEATRSIVETGNADEAKAEIGKLKDKRSALEAKISELQSGGGVAELKVKYQELEAQRRKVKNALVQKNDELLSELRQKIEGLQSRADTIAPELRKQRNLYADKEASADKVREKIAKIAQDIETLKAKEPLTDEEPDTCPYCEQPIPKKHNHEEYVKEFNREKAEGLKSLKADLKIADEQLSAITKEMEEVKAAGLKLNSQASQIESAIKQKQDELAEKKKSVTPVTETEAYKKLVSEQEEIQAKIDNHRDEKQKQFEQLRKTISELNTEIEQHESVVYQTVQNEKTKVRIDELRAERKHYAEELERVEADLNLIDEFIRVRSNIITDRVNDKFRYVRWELFREQINGGLEPVAEAYYDGKPYSRGASNSERIKAGMDIVNTLSKHYGKALPIVADNLESVTKLPDMGELQIIALYVSEKDKALRFEIQKQRKAA